MTLRKSGSNSLKKTIVLIIKDFSFAMIGLIVSIAIAIGVNDQLSFASMIEKLPTSFSEGITQFFIKLGLK